MKQWGIILVIAVILVNLPTLAVDLDLTTTVPEYIMEDHLFINGTASDGMREYSDDYFQAGTSHNLTVTGDSIILEPELEFDILNNGRPIFEKGSGSSWDSGTIGAATYLVHQGKYYMYYHGSSTYHPFHIGMATSDDGITWTRYAGNPVLRSGIDSFDRNSAFDPNVIIVNGTWMMYYCGMNTRTDICLATSPDGYNWTKNAENPILRASSSHSDWNGQNLKFIDPSFDGGEYRTYVEGMTGDTSTRKLGLATSPDGINWSYHPSSPLYDADDAAWYNGHIHFSDVEGEDGSYRTWISGNSSSWSIGWLTSQDGIDWEDSGGPVMTPKAGAIYSSHIYAGMRLDDGDRSFLYAYCEDEVLGRTMGGFNVTTLNGEGWFQSRQLYFGGAAGGVMRLNTAEWAGDVPVGGEVRFYIRWSNLSSSYTDWMEVKDPSDVAGISCVYAQYRVDMSSRYDWYNVTLDSVTFNYTIPIRSIEIRVDDGPWKHADGNLTYWYSNLSLTDGDHLIRIKVTDAFGGGMEIHMWRHVDLFPPVGEVVLEGGAVVTDSKVLDFEMNATDTHGIVEMMVSLSEDFPGGTWEPYSETGEVTYTGDDGYVTLYARFKDAAGRVSEVVKDSVLVDTAAPTGTITINDGATLTNSTTVSLDLSFTDLSGVLAMMISNDPTFQDASWDIPATSLDWQLDETDGSKSVHVRLRDAAGWTTDVSDDIILDTTPPELFITAPEFTLSRDVEFLWTAADENGIETLVLEVLDSEGSTMSVTITPVQGGTGSVKQPGQFTIEELWTPGDAETYIFTVLISVLDTVGWRNVSSSQVTYIPEVPIGDLVLGSGDWTNETTVDVTLAHTGGLSPTHFRLASTEAGLDGASWYEWTETTTFELGLPGGEKPVWGQMKGIFDVVSEPFSDTINLDVVEPTVVIDAPTKGKTDTETMKMTATVTDDLDPAPSREWRLNGGEWTTYEGETRLTLKEGTNLIEIRSRDGAGNMGVDDHSIKYEREMSTTGMSWIILAIVLVVIVIIGVWCWWSHQAGGS